MKNDPSDLNVFLLFLAKKQFFFLLFQFLSMEKGIWILCQCPIYDSWEPGSVFWGLKKKKKAALFNFMLLHRHTQT